MTAAAPPGWPAMSIEQAHAILTAPGMPTEVAEAEIDGRPTPVWKNLPPTLRDVVQLARAHGDGDFLVHEDERVGFEAFHRAVAALAAELAARCVAKGDRVAIVMRNLPEWAAAFYATVSLGAIATPLNAWWAGPELEYALNDCGARVLIADGPRFERLADRLSACPALKVVYVARADGALTDPMASPLEAVIGAPDRWAALPERPLPAAEIAPDDPAAIFYTSGTTGRPKGALATHRAINSNIMALLFNAARVFLRRGEAPPTPPRRSTLISIPFFHVTGCCAVLNPTLFGGGKLTMMRRWNTVLAFELIERERVQAAGGVPAIAWQLLEHPARGRYDLSSLQTLSYGGAPASPELVRRIKAAFPNALPGNGWGMTETCASVTGISGEDYVNRPESCGVAVAVSRLQVRDSRDGATVLPPDTVGELWASGPQIVNGYWNNPEATALTFVDGWVRTGDLARVDEEGFCYIVDRAKDMLIRGGENIYCIEVENALYEHPAVMDAALVGIPHRVLGEEPAAVVTLKPGAQATEAELRAHVAERLAAFKTPVAVRFLPQGLPRNPQGKILKTELKALFEEGAP